MSTVPIAPGRWTNDRTSSRQLLEAGHEVVRLARSDKSAAALAAVGAEARRGVLDDLDSLRKATAAADGVIHLAFMHGSNFADAGASDLQVIVAMGAALDGPDKPFVASSGTAGLTPGRW